jgi:cell division protein FtsI (penicillin-binding protein 3)
MRPYVVRRVQRADGSVVFEREPQVLGRTVTRETATLMRALLTRVTEPEGTGTRAAVEGFQVAGKTGTAQKPIGGVYSETDYMASFVGFLPADKPEIGIIVVVDNPQPLHTGGMVSAPVFGEIAEQTVRYLDIVPPSYAMTGP